MSSERETKSSRSAGLRARILGATGSACLVVIAVAAVPGEADAADRATPGTDASSASSDATARAHVLADGANPDGTASAKHPKQWWHNGWARPWGNWNNWQNWPNWHNWHNWGRGW